MSTSQMSTRMANQRGGTAAGALALFGGLLGVASVLLPWATISIAELEGMPGLGESESFTGWTFNEGKILVVLASLVVLMGFILIVKRLTGGTKAVAIGAIVLSLAMLGIAAYDIIQVKDTTADKIGAEITTQVDQSADIPPEQQAAVDAMVAQVVDAIQVSIGIGLYIALVGSILGIIGGALGLKGGGGAEMAAAQAPSTAPVAPPMPAQPLAAPAAPGRPAAPAAPQPPAAPAAPGPPAAAPEDATPPPPSESGPAQP